MGNTTTLILGGGFGGVAAAQTLRSLLPNDHKIILIDKSPHFLVGATKTWVMLGTKNADDIMIERQKILPRDVDFIEAEIQKINTKSKEVETSRGKLSGDYMIVALGADLDMGAIPGLDRAAYSFYTVGDAMELKDRLEEFRAGELVFLIPQIPFKCPPAPYEAALMLDDHFRRMNIRDQVPISIYTIEPGPMATAGPEMSSSIRALIEERAIHYHPQKQTKSVDERQKKIIFKDGSEKSYNLLIGIPPHRVPAPLFEAGLCNESGWIPVDPKTMKVTSGNNTMPVYAVGDNTVVTLPGRYKPDKPLVLPKAGVFAASQGIVAAKQIAAAIMGKPAADEFDGSGYCYIETGGGKAIKGEGSFFKMPHPQMERRDPDNEQFRDKIAWIEGWLKGKIMF